MHNILRGLNKDVIRTCLLLLTFLCADATAGVVDRIVVVVDRDLVMQSDIRFEEVMSGLDPTTTPFWNRERSTPQQRLVDAALLQKLAGTVSLYEPDPDHIAKRLERIRKRFGTLDAWSSFLEFWGFSEMNFLRLLRRRMVVELYLSRNLQTEETTLEKWQPPFEELMKEVRERFRIRYVPQESPNR